MLAAAVIVQLLPTATANRIKGTRNLAAEGWPDVNLVGGENARIQAKGYVADADALKRLQTWIKANDFDTASMNVRIGADLVNRVKEALASDPTLTVAYLGSGTVRVSGVSDSLATRERLSRVKADLLNVVLIDDQVAIAPMGETKPREHTLPIRIVDVRPGSTHTTGSFGTENNTRYFVGAVLPDGSEVVSIKSDSIEFSLDNKIIVFPLK
jgi:hypothetical protein